MENAEWEITRRLKVLSSIDPNKANEVDEPTWVNYRIQYDNDKNLCASVNDFKTLVGKKDISPLPTLSGSLSTQASSGSPALYITFKDTPLDTPKFQQFVKEHKIAEHPIKIYDFITSELSTIDKSVGEAFEKICRDLISAEKDTKERYLSDIRHLIFYQLFDVYCPESNITKTIWYNATPRKTPERFLRFCQPKYFILGNTDYYSQDPVLQKRIDDLCHDLAKHFDVLSDLAKHGTTDKQAEITFNQTISTISAILSLRNNLYTS